MGVVLWVVSWWLLQTAWLFGTADGFGDFIDAEAVDDVIKNFLDRNPQSIAPVSQALGPPDDLHVIILDTSRYYHNYRHVTNAVVFYRIVQWFGVPESKIHLMLAECSACDPRNTHPGKIFLDGRHKHDIYMSPGPLQVSFRTLGVNARSWVDLVRGRAQKFAPISQRLKTTAKSNVLLYINGHGGNQFQKFHDFEELSSDEMGEAISELQTKKKFRELIVLIDSCQALTLSKHINTPNTMLIGSSLKDENAYSCNDDQDIGLSLMDRFTHLTAKFFEQFKVAHANISVSRFIKNMDEDYLLSPPGIRDDRFGRSATRTPLLEFLADPRLLQTPGQTEPTITDSIPFS